MNVYDYKTKIKCGGSNRRKKERLKEEIKRRKKNDFKNNTRLP